MNFFIASAAIALIFGCGYGVQALLVRSRSALNLAERFALSWLTGSGVISILIWIFGFVVRGPVLPIFVFCAGMLLAWLGWRRAVVPALSFRRFSVFEGCLAAIIAAQIATMFYLASIHTLGWDGLLNWEIKARYAWLNNGVLPASYFQDEGRSFSHSEYPLCIPFTELWLYFWLGDSNQHCAKIIFPIFYAAGVILLASSLQRLSGRNYIGLVAAVLLFFIPQITVDNGAAIFGYADFPLAVCYLAAITFLLRSIDGVDCFPVYAVALALLPWIKRDGVLLWAVAAFCGALVILVARKSRSHFLMLLPGFIIIGVWQGYLHSMHVIPSQEFSQITFDSFRAHSYRIVPIAGAVFMEFRHISAWSVLWLGIGFGCLQLLRHIRRLRSIILLVAVCTPFVIYPAVYIFSNWPDYLLHLHLSLSRLFMHVVPLGLVIAGLAAAAGVPQKARRRAGTPSCTAAVSERTPAIEFA